MQEYPIHFDIGYSCHLESSAYLVLQILYWRPWIEAYVLQLGNEMLEPINNNQMTYSQRHVDSKYTIPPRSSVTVFVLRLLIGAQPIELLMNYSYVVDDTAGKPCEQVQEKY